MPNNLHAGHRMRLKKRFLSEGIDSFEDHNILELLLFYAIPQRDTNAIAHELINHFGGLANVFDAPISELVKINGITENGATLIKLIPSYARVYMHRKAYEALDMSRAEAVGEYFKSLFIGKTIEQIYMMSIDSSCRLIACDLLAEGAFSQVNINIRAITQIALKRNAYSVILAHNHPFGMSKPSNEDVLATTWIKNALKQLDIKFLDHIIVGNDEFSSLAELGFM